MLRVNIPTKPPFADLLSIKSNAWRKWFLSVFQTQKVVDDVDRTERFEPSIINNEGNIKNELESLAQRQSFGNVYYAGIAKKILDIERKLALIENNVVRKESVAEAFTATIDYNTQTKVCPEWVPETKFNYYLPTIVWDDIKVPPGSFDRPGVNDPTTVLYYPNGGAIGVLLYEFQIDDYACFSVQMPHGYKEGSDIYAHIHWTPGDRGNEESGNIVGWKLDYSWANINSAFTDMQTLDLSDACDGTDHLHQKTPEAAISGAAKGVSSMLVCNVRRTDTGADDTWVSILPGELPLLLEIDFHYQIDTIGSRLEFYK